MRVVEVSDVPTSSRSTPMSSTRHFNADVASERKKRTYVVIRIGRLGLDVWMVFGDLEAIIDDDKS